MADCDPPIGLAYGESTVYSQFTRSKNAMRSATAIFP